MWVNIEIYSACNLRCRYCSLDHEKNTTVMTEATLTEVLSKLSKLQHPIERIELHNGGETLLHPNLDVMLGVLKKYRNDIPGLPRIVLLTNATPLSKKKIDQIMSSGVVDFIRFSVDGGTAEKFESLRFPALWVPTARKIHNFLDANEAAGSRIETGVICVIDPDKAPVTDWMEDDFKALFARMDNVELRWPHNWDGSVEKEIDDHWFRDRQNQSQGKVCFFLQENFVVLPNGDTTVCCADLNNRGDLGNVSDLSAADFFNSEKRQNMIRAFVENKKDSIELCRNCTGYYP